MCLIKIKNYEQKTSFILKPISLEFSIFLTTNYIFGWTIPTKNPPEGNVSLETGATPAGSTGYIQFNDSGNLGADSNLFWNNINKYLGIRTSNPGVVLDVQTPGYGFPATSGSTQTYGGLRISPPTASGNVVLDMGVNTSQGAWLQTTNRTNLATNYPLLLNPNGGNVGIGTAAPGSKLHVVGAVTVQGNLKITGGSPGSGKVLISDAGGLASWQSPSVKTAIQVCYTLYRKTAATYNGCLGGVSGANAKCAAEYSGYQFAECVDISSTANVSLQMSGAALGGVLVEQEFYLGPDKGAWCMGSSQCSNWGSCTSYGMGSRTATTDCAQSGNNYCDKAFALLCKIVICD